MSERYTTQELEFLYNSLGSFNKDSLDKENKRIIELQNKDIDYFIDEFRNDKVALDSRFWELHRKFLFGSNLAFSQPSTKTISYLHDSSLELINELSSKYHDWIRAESALIEAREKIKELENKLQEKV